MAEPGFAIRPVSSSIWLGLRFAVTVAVRAKALRGGVRGWMLENRRVRVQAERQQRVEQRVPGCRAGAMVAMGSGRLERRERGCNSTEPQRASDE
jgi:hypothetical protein